MYLDCKADESYTPSKLAIKGGMHMQDLKVARVDQEIRQIEFKDPQEWYIIPLTAKMSDGSEK